METISIPWLVSSEMVFPSGLALENRTKVSKLLSAMSSKAWPLYWNWEIRVPWSSDSAMRIPWEPTVWICALGAIPLSLVSSVGF